ncbi:Protoporphyrinogen oxidase [Rubripirellula lacrimiformis]|uniref:Coproporphyrinogen III oxidase n=1 Tax=Rubripirellula lacrimiformis TaxID=1930273 RepID=A0A517NGY5_9BACT|nr:protoporphyrinogen oxidase [Rubripirellula lacrimiformis]QDT06323.1 Protoporphyrinogen oxidase [Rubripirellula lacrimiformis]
MQKRRVGIIGGGLSGLATAAQLHLDAADSIELTVFEASPRTGGVIHTEMIDGFLVDHGADMFATKPPDALRLCERLGVADKLIEPLTLGRGARIVRGGRLVSIPDGFVLMRGTKLWPMLTTGLLSPKGKLRYLIERFVVAPPEIEDDEYDESVEQFVRRRMGDEVLDRIVAPLSAGIYTADITKLSMRATMAPIAEMERKFGSLARATAARRRSGEDNVERGSTGARYGQFRSFPGGMIQLIESLANSLPPESIRINCPVANLSRQQDHWDVTTAAGETMAFDHVVVATNPRPAAKILADIAPQAADGLSKIESTSTAIVVLGLRKSDIQRDINTFGFVVPATENRRILAGSFASHKFAGRAPEGHVLIRCFVGGALQPELLRNDDETLIQMVRQELAELIGLTGEPVMSRVVRWNEAMPQYHIGHGPRVKQIQADIDAVPHLSVINNAMGGVGIAPVIRSAGKIDVRN